MVYVTMNRYQSGDQKMRFVTKQWPGNEWLSKKADTEKRNEKVTAHGQQMFTGLGLGGGFPKNLLRYKLHHARPRKNFCILQA